LASAGKSSRSDLGVVALSKSSGVSQRRFGQFAGPVGAGDGAQCWSKRAARGSGTLGRWQALSARHEPAGEAKNASSQAAGEDAFTARSGKFRGEGKGDPVVRPTGVTPSSVYQFCG